MISVLLTNMTNDVEIDRTAKPGNDVLLLSDDLQNSDLLKQLDLCSYDVFSSSDMPKLIDELAVLRSHLENEDDAEHIASIISLAERCGSDKNLILTFTPFESLIP